MYIPDRFKSESNRQALEYIKSNGFATLVSTLNGQIIASHIPMYVQKESESEISLLGHIAAANEQRHCLDGSQEMLAIFMNKHAYISSSWYGHINVPTWNYVAIHVYGTASVISGEELYLSINNLVEMYEDGRQNRFHMTDMPTKMIEAHFKGLVGFKMKVSKIEAAQKLSQNRNTSDYENIIAQLEKEGDQGSIDIAKEMKNLKS